MVERWSGKKFVGVDANLRRGATEEENIRGWRRGGGPPKNRTPTPQICLQDQIYSLGFIPESYHRARIKTPLKSLAWSLKVGSECFRDHGTATRRSLKNQHINHLKGLSFQQFKRAWCVAQSLALTHIKLERSLLVSPPLLSTWDSLFRPGSVCESIVLLKIPGDIRFAFGLEHRYTRLKQLNSHTKKKLLFQTKSIMSAIKSQWATNLWKPKSTDY